MSIRQEIQTFLHPDLIEDFAKWAFGDDFKLIPSSEKFMDKWNERHSDLFMIRGSDTYYSTIPKMINIWMDIWLELKK